MRTRILWTVALLAISGVSAALSVIGASKGRDIPANVLAVFKKRCVRCHTGPKPPKGLSLIPGRAPSIIDAPSAEVPGLMIIDPNTPEASYLLKKVRREKGIAGKPMPPGKALPADELQVLETWILGLK